MYPLLELCAMLRDSYISVKQGKEEEGRKAGGTGWAGLWGSEARSSGCLSGLLSFICNLPSPPALLSSGWSGGRLLKPGRLRGLTGLVG